MTNTAVFDVFEQCVLAIQSGELIQSVSAKDKEFHFQNWFQQRLQNLGVHYEELARNTYPDFRLVEYSEGYEVKGLVFPGRGRDYDANSQHPTGYHNGRQIYYVFGRYPEPSSITEHESGSKQYPVIDLVVCHGDFLNANHQYVHKNTNVKGFGSYGDIMIRDRKMYVPPTPFALAEGMTGLMTLVLPESAGADPRFQVVGQLTRVEAASLMVGYTFDLRTNDLRAETIPNASAGAEHRFTAYRLRSQAPKPVTMLSPTAILEAVDVMDRE